jgi:hypothetical protein
MRFGDPGRGGGGGESEAIEHILPSPPGQRKADRLNYLISSPSIPINFRKRSGRRRQHLLGTKAIQILKDGKGFNSPKAIFRCGSSSVGRASAFQAEGRGFDPRFPLQFFGIQLVEMSDYFGQPVLFN